MLCSVELISAVQQCESALSLSLHTHTHTHTHISLPPEHPLHLPTPCYPSESAQSTKLRPLCYPAVAHYRYLFHTWWCVHADPNLPSHPTLSAPCVHKSSLHVCVSVPALQIGSSVEVPIINSTLLGGLPVSVCMCKHTHAHSTASHVHLMFIFITMEP